MAVRHIYVHVPFCARRCSYCDFSIAVRKRIPAERYVATVAAELNLRRSQGAWDDTPLETLYFGGGTPSLLPAENLSVLIELLSPLSRPGSAPSAHPSPLTAHPALEREVTLEANPDDVTPAAAAAWKRAGITRVSLGAQSFNPAVLAWMHRTHGVDAVPSAVDTLRAAGIAGISLDLIFALPDELAPDFERDLAEALVLAPDHLSVYGLSVEPRTPLSRWISRGATTAPSEERYAREFIQADRTLTGAGFEHYEVSNYALPGRRSRHNSVYWAERPYAGLGPAAHSFSNEERRWNIADWSAYERVVSGGGDPTAERERLTPGQRSIERLYLALRTVEGVDKRHWPARASELERIWASTGWLTDDWDRYRLTPEGWLRLDEIVTVLTTSDDSG